LVTFGLVASWYHLSFQSSEESFQQSLYQKRWLADTVNVNEQKQEINHVKTAYVILVHNNETLKGAQMLLEAIYSEHDTFVLHVDKQYTMTDEDQAYWQNIPQNVIQVDKRMEVMWGSLLMVKATLLSLRTATNHDWDYAFLLDGLSFPMTSSAERNRRLSLLPADHVQFDGLRPLCEYNPIRNVVDHFCSRGKGRCLNERCDRMRFTPKNGVVWRGSQWGLMSRSFVEYVLGEEEDELQPWMEYFKSTLIPDESLFHTIAMNSGFRKKVRGLAQGKEEELSRVMFTKWDETRCGRNHPCDLRPLDVEEAINSRALFARKVPLKGDQSVRLMLQSHW
jgi:hypothetical protein